MIAVIIIGGTFLFWAGFLFGIHTRYQDDCSFWQRAYLKGWDACARVARSNASAVKMPSTLGIRFSKN